MKKILSLFVVFFLTLFLVPQVEAALLVTQPIVSSGDSWIVNYNNGQTFEFDMNYSGQWPVLLCKNSASGSVGIWFQSNEVYVKTSSGFSQRLGEIYSVGNEHYKIICNNSDVAVYYNGNLLGNTTDPSINVPSNNFVNNPRVDFVANGYTQMTNFSIFNTNAAPSISTISDATINEGQSYTENGSFADTDSTSWTATVNYGDGSDSQPLTLNSDNTFSLNHVYKDNGTYTVTVSITDNQGAIGIKTATVTVNNVTPSVSAITVSVNLVQINASTTATATFTDPGVLDTHTAVWNWGDGTTSTGTITESNGSGSASDSHTYTTAGVYIITLNLTDKDGGVGTQTYQYLSVYNPTAQGLFSAGQKFTSPVGAYTQNPNITGNVLFGLSYKYQGTVPSGNRQFSVDFNQANLHFNATSVSSLVINSGLGTLTGTGTINDSGTYNFLVTGSESANTVRIQIKDQSGSVIYDTQPGASTTTTPTTPVTAGKVLAH